MEEPSPQINTNMDRWMYYMKDCTSPRIFIEWGFYSLIASCLQRRVWTGTMRKPLFPNIFTVLTGSPGIGKGLVIKEIAKLLRHHKVNPLKTDNNTIFDMGKFKQNLKSPSKADTLLIPVGPESTTFENLVHVMAQSSRIHWNKGEDGKPKDVYNHCSLTICLEELSSLFRKHSDDLVNFLLVTYDCGDYIRDTIGRGEDRVESCCFNMLAGTTPSFIKRIFGDELITDGFSSRTFFIHALSNRFSRLRPPEFNELQIEHYNILLEHIKLLGNLYGECKFTPEAIEYLEYWWCNEHPRKRANNSPKLIPYYARKSIHVQKLAMILHFADSTEMVVGLDKCQMALSVLEYAEKQMHFAITMDNKNPLHAITKEIYTFLSDNGGATKKDLLLIFGGELPNGESSLLECLKYLMTVGKVAVSGMSYIAVKEKEG